MPKPKQWWKEAMAAFSAKGGKARAKKLSAKKRKEIATDAAKARWKKKRKTGRTK